jgi:hypothetical protein
MDGTAVPEWDVTTSQHGAEMAPKLKEEDLCLWEQIYR